MKPLFSARKPEEARNEARSYVDAPGTLGEIDAEIDRLRIALRILNEYERSLIDTADASSTTVADLRSRP